MVQLKWANKSIVFFCLLCLSYFLCQTWLLQVFHSIQLEIDDSPSTLSEFKFVAVTIEKHSDNGGDENTSVIFQETHADTKRSSVEGNKTQQVAPEFIASLSTLSGGHATISEQCGPSTFSRHAHNSEFSIYYPPPLSPDMVHNNSVFRIAQKPRYGKHRCDKNAVMAFAHGYQLPQIIHFVATLLKTGYDGDLVIGVGKNLTHETRSYLEYQATHRTGFVVYEIDLACQRKNSCQVKHLLEETKNTEQSSWMPLVDARPFRRVSVIRYEYYWAWANHYSSESLLFLTDARDVYFQGDPMEAALHNNDLSSNNGTLIFFEEAAKIGDSKANLKWIEKTYSPELARAMQEHMVICSGTSLGFQPAIETYARAMVHEFDQTKCRRCANKHDQCFHNYLIHQNRLVGANNWIKDVVVHPQGEGGIVNTVGLLPIQHDGKSLQELGLILNNNESRIILQNDAKSRSAVIHMYDRDVSMKEWVDMQIQKELDEAILQIQNSTII